MRTAHPEVIATLGSGKIDDDVMKTIEATMADIASTYKA
jgi:F-type H+-transporting ATPase subunit alpha